MLRSYRSAVALTLILAGCAQDSVSPPVPVQRALSGHCETTFNPPPQPLPQVHRQVDSGTCDLVPMGRMTFAGEQDINFAAGTQSGQPTFTAANGDVLRGANAGTSSMTAPGVVSFTATLTVNGGTGRFAGATGQARIQGTANMATRSTTLTIVEGSITY